MLASTAEGAAPAALSNDTKTTMQPCVSKDALALAMLTDAAIAALTADLHQMLEA